MNVKNIFHKLNNHQGFTLVELIVGIAIFSIVLAVGYNMYYTEVISYEEGEESSNVRQNVRLAADLITQELRYATHVELFDYTPNSELNNDNYDDYNFIYYDDEGFLIFRKVGEESKRFFESISQEEYVNLELEFEFRGSPVSYLYYKITNVGDDSQSSKNYYIESTLSFLNILEESIEPENENKRIAIAYKNNMSASITPQNSENKILDYSFPDDIQLGDTLIMEEDNLIIVQVSSDSYNDNIVADFVLSDGAAAYVNDVEQFSGISANNFSNSVDIPFIYTVEAEDGTSREWRVVVYSDIDGLVLVDNMPTSFSHEIYEPESEIIILSDNGYIEMERDIYFVGDTVKIESGVTFYSNSNEYNIDIQAEEDITVESGVVFETDHNKSDISLLSNSGNIVINGVDFSVNQNSNHNTIDISAPEGSVYMQGTKLKATREISVEAKENIFAGPNDDNNAEIIVTQSNEDIRFTISELTGKICVTDLKLDYGNAGSAIATPINNVCGILHEESKCIQGYTPQECN